MKPSQLRPPFKWAERRVHLDGKILFVPDLYDKYEEFTFPGWEAIFGNHQPVKIEFCSGNGDWIARQALENLQTNWVAIEKRFDRCQKIWSKLHNYNLQNLFIVCGEALKTTYNYFPSFQTHEVFINFPDPWPKNRHAKNRLINQAFVTQLERILIPEGFITLVTDDPTYSKQTILELMKNPSLRSVYNEPYFITDYPDYGPSYFKELWQSKGCTIHYHRFFKFT